MLVDRIAVTPVKGLGLNHPDAVDVTEAGVVGDRRFAMVDERGRAANGKRLGELVRVRVAYDEATDGLVLDLPDGSQVGGEVALGDEIETVFYGATRTARLVLGDYAEALSALAGEPLRLVQMPVGTGIDRIGVGAVSLQSTASLDALAREAGAAGAVDGRRFRMTFTVDGADEHDEDTWIGRVVHAGTAAFAVEGNIGRCAVTTQNPDSGVPDLDTLKTLARYRGALPTSEPLPFGVHARVVVPGRVAVGDDVVVR
jgi:hypothetical protein